MSLDSVPAAEVPVDVTASGDIVIVPGVVGQTIRIVKLFLMVDGDTLFTFKDGPATEFSGPLTFSVGGNVTLDQQRPPRYWFKTSDGNAFIVNLTTAVRLTGRVYYTQSA